MEASASASGADSLACSAADIAEEAGMRVRTAVAVAVGSRRAVHTGMEPCCADHMVIGHMEKRLEILVAGHEDTEGSSHD